MRRASFFACGSPAAASPARRRSRVSRIFAKPNALGYFAFCAGSAMRSTCLMTSPMSFQGFKLLRVIGGLERLDDGTHRVEGGH